MNDVSGKPMWARYDPPWKPGFPHRNEVLVPIGPIGEELS